MGDINCPYCGHGKDVDHSEGHGYEEDVEHWEQCPECEKEFHFTTYTSYSYTTYCKVGTCEWGEWVRREPKGSPAFTYRSCKRDYCDNTEFPDPTPTTPNPENDDEL